MGPATIAAAIGAGGLGEYIFRGLSMVDSTVILAGAIPAALLALIADGAADAGSSGGCRQAGAIVARAPIAIAAAALLVADIDCARRSRPGPREHHRDWVEEFYRAGRARRAARADARAAAGSRSPGASISAASFICDRAIRSGDIDAYVEYTGTALAAILKQPVVKDLTRALAALRDAYGRVGLSVLAPLGFNNTFAIVVRRADADALGLKTIDDLRRLDAQWRPGFGYEFAERTDGYAGLASAYGLRFAAPPRVMDLDLVYRALASRQVDVIAGDATSGLIKALDLAMLQDNRAYFPPYYAVPIVRSAVLLAHPEVRDALARLAGRISEDDMRAMNAAVDVDHRDVAATVREFLTRVE